MNLSDLAKKAEAAKNKTTSHVKNHLIAYACGAASVACFGAGKFETKQFIGDDGHPGIEVVGAADEMRATAGIALGSVAACSAFMNVLRRMTEQDKKDAAMKKFLEQKLQNNR